MTIESVPIEVVNLIKDKPIVAYKFMASLCSQALMFDGVKHTKDDVDLVIYNYLDSVNSQELTAEDWN